MKKIEGYLSVGKTSIDPEAFNPIFNTDSPVPQGGFWASKHEYDRTCYNDWMDYLTEKPHLIYYKYPMYPIPAVFFTLKEDANILQIDSAAKYDAIKASYPGKFDNIDFESLAEVYDGLFIDVSALAKDETKQNVVQKFSVSSLLLFNFNCIREYRQASIFIEVDHNHGFPLYEYNIVPKRKKYTIENGPVLKREKKDAK